MASLGPLIGLAALGAFHGINPAMGWLFAVSLGLQRQNGWAIGSAVVFIAIGHVFSLATVAVALGLAGYFIPLFWVRLGAGIVPAPVRGVQVGLVLSPFPVGGHECWRQGPGCVVFPDGYVSWRRTDAGAHNLEPGRTGSRSGSGPAAPCRPAEHRGHRRCVGPRPGAYTPWPCWPLCWRPPA